MRSALTRGTVVAAVAASLAYAIARWGFGRLYYLGALLPFESFLFIAAAWFRRLRAGGFAGYAGPPASGPASPGTPGSGPAGAARGSAAALLVAAAWLALAATALYFGAGIGASFYL